MTPNPLDKPLRLALYVDQGTVPVWVEQLRQELDAQSCAEVIAVIVAPDRRRAARQGGGTVRWRDGRLARGVRSRIQKLYRKLVDRNRTLEDAWKPAGVDALADLPSHALSTPVDESQLAPLTALQLDVIVHCGLREVPSDVLARSSFGVWSLLGCPATMTQAYPAGFWPAMTGDALTRSLLSVTFADRAPVVLADSWMATSRHSTRDNVSRHYWKMLYSVPRALRRLYDLGPSLFWDDARRRTDQSLARHHSPDHPSATRYAAYVLRAIWRKAFQLVDTNLFEQRWRLRRAAPIDPGTGGADLGEIEHNPHLCYRADPFLFADGDQRWLFYEEYCDRRSLGHLSVQAVDAQGMAVGEPEVILQKPYHLSYPQVFEWQGEHYMLPETSGNKTVELYRATRFPFDWTLQAVLMEDIDASDATLWFENDLWWLFANVKSHPAVSSQDECYVYFSETLEGPWQSHPLNPVVSDCRVSRPGGAMLRKGNRLLRPTQDSTYRYGYGLNFMQVTELSTTDFAEVLVEHFPPRRRNGAIGMHSYAELDGFAYVDELVREPRWKNRVRD